MSIRHPSFKLRRGGLSALVLCLCWLTPSVAKAELKLCNSTSSKVGVAIGYKDKDGWTSEGWWNVDSQSCSVLIQDRLRARFYYIFAFDYDKGGEWGGPIPMCTAENEFTIKGIDNCEGRNYKRSNFFEVDTQEQSDWTVKLTEQPDAAATQVSDKPAQGTPTPPVAAPKQAENPGAVKRK